MGTEHLRDSYSDVEFDEAVKNDPLLRRWIGLEEPVEGASWSEVVAHVVGRSLRYMAIGGLLYTGWHISSALWGLW